MSPGRAIPVNGIFFSFADFCNTLPVEGREQIILTNIIPCVKELVNDTSQHVKAALATVIMGLAPVLGNEKWVSCMWWWGA